MSEKSSRGSGKNVMALPHRIAQILASASSQATLDKL